MISDEEIFVIETLEREDYLDKNLAFEYRSRAMRHDSASIFLDGDARELATMLAAWERKVADAIDRYHGV